MLSNNSDLHGPICPSNETIFFQELDSQLGGLLDSTPKNSREDISKKEQEKGKILEYARKIRQVQRLRKKPDIKIKFVDYDNTLSEDKWRFVICKELITNRGKKALGVIEKHFGKNGSNGIKEYVSVLKPNEHLLEYHEFYDPKNPNHIILTAGPEELQRLKIENSGFGNPNYIIVGDHDQKIRAIIDYILELGYVPGSFEFIDDKVDYFNGIDQKLSKLLGIEINFLLAIPQEDKTVKLVKLTQSVQSDVNELLKKQAEIGNPMVAQNDVDELLRA